MCLPCVSIHNFTIAIVNGCVKCVHSRLICLNFINQLADRSSALQPHFVVVAVVVFVLVVINSPYERARIHKYTKFIFSSLRMHDQLHDAMTSATRTIVVHHQRLRFTAAKIPLHFTLIVVIDFVIMFRIVGSPFFPRPIFRSPSIW